MRMLIPILTALLALVLPSLANNNDDIFRKAQTAYDEGRYAEAVVLYTKLIDSGIDNTEVHYNLANACFKDSELSTAVWHYRKAWYQAPRDPDIRANLHFALNAAGAVEPSPHFTERIGSTLAKGEWILMAYCAYALLAVLLILALLLRPARRILLKLCLIPLTALLLAVAGWRYWHAYQQLPEWVVVQTEATALFGPVAGSTTYYKVPLGALVRQCNADSKGWIEVEYDGKQGWLQSKYISRVSP